MESCYEYFDCQKKDCLMFKESSGKQCWEIEETLCNFPGIERLREKQAKSEACNTNSGSINEVNVL
jgi:hypothetical protein